MSPALTPEHVRDLLTYEPETGVFRWRKTLCSRGPVGHVAGHAWGRAGYVGIGIAGRRYLAHRLAWFCVNGVWPAGQIDHINGNRADNRIEGAPALPEPAKA